MNLAICVLLSLVVPQSAPPHAPNGVERWTVEPDLVVGEPDVSLTTISSLAVSANGSIYIAQPDEQLIRVVAADGTLQRAIGRKGRGPGEFQRPWFLGWMGDTLVVADGALVRISAFDSAGSLLYTVSTLQGAPPHQPRAILTDGRVLLEEMQESDDQLVDGDITSRSLLLMKPGGGTFERLVDLSLGTHAEARVGIVVGGETTYTYFEHPFPDSDLYDVDPRGRSVVVVSQIAGDDDNPRFSVTRLATAGDTAWAISFSYTPLPPSAMTRDTLAALAAKLTQHPYFKQRVPRERIERSLRRDIDVPAHLAPVSAVIAGRDGTVWLRREPVGTEAQWMVLDSSGAYIAVVHMPFDFRALEADRHYVWGVETGDMGEPRLVRYRVHAAT